jgi:hypothetical protein
MIQVFALPSSGPPVKILTGLAYNARAMTMRWMSEVP